MDDLKVCSKCKKEFPNTIEYYSRNSKCKDGLNNVCKLCCNQNNKIKNQKYKNEDKNKICKICNSELNKRINFHINKENNDGYSDICKICEDNIAILKTCSSCKRIFPATLSYFHKDKYNKDGLVHSCKECRTGNKIFDKLKLKDNYKFCVKCGRELPINIKYFPPDKTCKDGFRSVCRECGKDGHFMNDDYIPKYIWTKEENKIFIQLYPHYTNEELIENFYPNETLKSLTDRAYKHGNIHKSLETQNKIHKIHSEKMSGENHPNYGKSISEETRRKMSLSKIGKYVGENNKLYGIPKSEEHKEKIRVIMKLKGRWKDYKNPRHLNPLFGESNGNWQGGIKQLYFDLRDKLSEWKTKSIKHCNYKCVVTGDDFNNVHHLFSFKNIVQEVFNIIDLPMHKTIGEYTENERNLIIDKLLDLHFNKYGLGVCLRKDIHVLFHNIYGYRNNTSDQFEEFRQRFYNGEFN